MKAVATEESRSYYQASLCAGYVLRREILDASPVSEDDLLSTTARKGSRALFPTCSISRSSSFLHLERMDQPVGTPAYGRRLLPVTIDQIAATQPDRAWASLPRTDTDLSQGYVEVTYRAFAKAINEVSWLIEKHFGRSENFETIAYLGMPDIRYYMLQMAAAKTGYQVCSFISFSYETDTL